jgi:hypothetical protein
LSDINAFYHHWFNRVDDHIERSDRNDDGYINQTDIDYVSNTVRQITNGEEISLFDREISNLNQDGEISLKDRDLMEFVQQWARDMDGNKVIDEKDADMPLDVRNRVMQARRLKKDMDKLEGLDYYQNPPAPIESTWITDQVIRVLSNGKLYKVTKEGSAYRFDNGLESVLSNGAGTTVTLDSVAYDLEPLPLSKIELRIAGRQVTNMTANTFELLWLQVQPIGKKLVFKVMANNIRVSPRLRVWILRLTAKPRSSALRRFLQPGKSV